VWDPAAKRSRVQVVYNFGREEHATREALEQLAGSVARHLEPGKARAITAEGLEFTESRPLGGTWALDALWQRLGIGPAMRELLKGRRPTRARHCHHRGSPTSGRPYARLCYASWLTATPS
jgi:hypothetical protein